MTELLKAINARMIAALRCLETGNVAEATAILSRISRLLPQPEDRHFEALSNQRKGEK